jgi:hypothetical protein
VVRRASREPQVILNRDRPVAAVIGADDLDAFLAWRKAQKPRPLVDALLEMSRVCEEEGYTFELEPRVDRPNPLLAGGKRAPRRHERRK